MNSVQVVISIDVILEVPIGLLTQICTLNMQTQDEAMLQQRAVSQYCRSNAEQLHSHKNVIDGAAGLFTEMTGFSGEKRT